MLSVSKIILLLPIAITAVALVDTARAGMWYALGGTAFYVTALFLLKYEMKVRFMKVKTEEEERESREFKKALRYLDRQFDSLKTRVTNVETGLQEQTSSSESTG